MTSPALDFERPSLLVVGPSWVGDMVMAQSLFMHLKARAPGVVIDVLAPSWSQPLLRRMAQVGRGLVMPVGHGQLGLAARYRLGRELRGRYGDAIVLPNSWKSALVPFFADIPRRCGFVGEWRFGLLNDIRRLDREQWPQTAQRFVGLGLGRGESLPMPLPTPELTHLPLGVCGVFRGLGIKVEGGPILALCPGAEYGSAKRWPVKHFRTLAARQVRRGWRVFILGSAKERELGQAIVDATSEGVVNLAGSTTLEEAVDLLAFAQAVVTNDSGLMHVAAALGRPVVAIFGSSDPRHTPPMNAHAQVLSLGLNCAPCFKRHCPLAEIPPCLEGITPEMVSGALPDQG